MVMVVVGVGDQSMYGTNLFSFTEPMSFCFPFYCNYKFSVIMYLYFDF